MLQFKKSTIWILEQGNSKQILVHQSKKCFFFFNEKNRIFIFTMWFILYQYFEAGNHSTGFKTPTDPRELFTQMKLPQTQLTLVLKRGKYFSTRENKFLRWVVFALNLQGGSLSISMFTNAVVPWRLLGTGSAQGRLWWNWVTHTYCNCCFVLFDTPCQVLEPE